MAKYSITITMPRSVERMVDRVRYQIRKWKVIFFPYKCTVCGRHLHTKAMQYEHVFSNHRRLLVQNLATDHLQCRDCLAIALATGKWTPRFTHMSTDRKFNYKFWSTRKCDITDDPVRSFKDVEIYPAIDMLFCGIAWNYGYMSKQAVIDTIRYGELRLSRWILHDGKMVCMSEDGLAIDQWGYVL